MTLEASKTAAEPLTQAEAIASLSRYGYGWVDSDVAGASAQRGLSEAVVRDISAKKNEPEWMLQNRLKALRIFERKPMPRWGSNLEGIDFDNIKYFVRSTEKQAASWDDLPEDIKNTYDRLGIPEAEKQRLVAGVAAQYECLAGETLVWTANRGQVPIKEIEFGDRVFSYDERAERFVVAPVKASAQTDTRLTYEVKTTRRSVRATDNHPMLVLRDERKEGRQRARYARRWVTVGEIKPGDFIAVPRAVPNFGVAEKLPSVAGLTTPAASSADLMWLLGLYVGDGNLHLSTKTYCVQFAIPATDRELRAELARVIKDLFGLRCIEADEYRVDVNSKALTEWIVALGFGGLSLTKRVPDWVYGLPVDQRLAFLGGWVDADGYVSPDKSGSIMLTCANQALIGQARELAELAGLRAGGPWPFTQPYRHAPERMQIAWRLGISGEFERLGCRNPKRTGRFGRRRFRHSSNSSHGTTIRVHCNDWLGFERVKSVEPYDVEPVYDLEVDGPHNFIAEGLVVHNSEVVYHQIREDLEAQGVIFLDTDTGLREHPDLFKQYFGTVIPAGDNKFSALNTAVWSGGSFIYVPPGVHVDIPLQAYFRINTENMGQFERTLIIVDENAYVHYVEGCTAPIYKSDSLHSAVVEIVVKPGGRCRYTTIQNWSNNVYNLVTKRARAEAGATMEWVDGNIGSKVTMKYPAVWMTGEHAKGEVLSVAFAGEDQHQDTGAKMLHLAPNTSSNIVSKSVARGGGRTSYRGLVQVNKGAHGSKSSVKCDALLVDTISRSDTYPYVDIREDDVTMGHEATVSKVSENQLFYLMSRGMTEDEAMAMVVRGFVEPIAKELPMEYALELNRLIELQMEGSVG
ncbi:Fe-S cluster assembly protein SufB [Mycobacterium attenuatum]|uniref:FeS cluster assembly protein SufB n=1 Tax=Mycobacterium attenuatum TaxID=2341086 RepID=A0A498Q1M5_9MYCO|nr:Fe-S cluster assembly protein SufB [Mycobacterium attenuatum]VBA38215.1 FeS cluster assembly protein SufB [Mycobacterium attenuatum]VBA51900.1 FeS cluster assembly protein SufB [Mycobacterium attenuatum]VBA57361.1 FeS cluster assembly protein SufB [Mycobacterium attenuatum]